MHGYLHNPVYCIVDSSTTGFERIGYYVRDKERREEGRKRNKTEGKGEVSFEVFVARQSPPPGVFFFSLSQTR